MVALQPSNRPKSKLTDSVCLLGFTAGLSSDTRKRESGPSRRWSERRIGFVFLCFLPLCLRNRTRTELCCFLSSRWPLLPFRSSTLVFLCTLHNPIVTVKPVLLILKTLQYL